MPASISERASGSDTGAICTPPATISCSPGAAPFDGTHGTLAGSIFMSRSMPAIARCQMPPCPVPDALNLPGFALIAATSSLADLVRRIGGDLQAGRIEVDQSDRRVRRAGELGQALPVHHADLDGDHADRVAVGRRRGDRRMADDAAAAGAVDDVDRLAQLLLEQGADDPRRGVGAAAGGPGHDQGDRAFRIRRLGNDGERERAEREDARERAREFGT